MKEKLLIPACERSCPPGVSRQSSPESLLLPGGLRRRTFLRLTLGASAGAVLGWAPGARGETRLANWDPDRPFRVLGRPLVVQPLLMYALPVKKPQASWRSWGAVQTEADVDEEVQRITQEHRRLLEKPGFALEILPVVKVTTPATAEAVANRAHDVALVYACTGSGSLLRACFSHKGNTLIFLRQRSGPVYYWYEALSTQYLQKDPPAPATDHESALSGVHVDDVVVDDLEELRWRLRALYALKNLRGARIVALGGPWGKYASDAPQQAKERFQLEVLDVSYESFAPRLRQARADRALLGAAEKAASRYLRLPKTKLATNRQAVVNAFVLYQVFKDLMRENDAEAFTVKSCMGTIIPMSETTACLPLEWLNDEGLIAFCESDFVIIPAGLLLRHIAAKPVFLHNSTFPHARMVTCAHCTCPRRMDGRHYAPAEILTHYESDYGAAPKVQMPLGQLVTFIDPEYSSARWLGFKGLVKANPFYQICRSQQDVEIQGDWQRLRNEVRDSHWVMVYGDYLREIGFAARKLGLQWVSFA